MDQLVALWRNSPDVDAVDRENFTGCVKHLYDLLLERERVLQDSRCLEKAPDTSRRLRDLAALATRLGARGMSGSARGHLVLTRR
jgi:hypothetical protein